MRVTSYLLIALSTLGSCENNGTDPQATPCALPYADLRRSDQSVSAVPATIIRLGSQSAYQILPAGGSDRVPWGACNLPQAYQQDSLNVTVSGYFLTSPFLEVANVSPLPFEITAIALRK